MFWCMFWCMFRLDSHWNVRKQRKKVISLTEILSSLPKSGRVCVQNGRDMVQIPHLPDIEQEFK